MLFIPHEEEKQHLKNAEKSWLRNAPTLALVARINIAIFVLLFITEWLIDDISDINVIGVIDSMPQMS